MIRVLKTDFFRLFRSKSFYAYPIFLVIFLTLELILTGIIVEKETVTDNDNGVTVEYYSTDENTNLQEDSTGDYTRFGIKDIFSSLSDGLLLLFLGITVVMFATGETRNGFNKNAAGSVGDRACMPLSKLAVGIVTLVIYTAEFAVIKLIFTGLTALMTGKPLSYTSLPEGDTGRYAVYVLLCILVHVAFTALIILLHELTQNRAAGIVAIFLVSTGLLGQLLIGITSMLKQMFGILEGFDISRYLMMSNINDGYTAESYHPMILFVIAAIYLAGGTAAAVMTARRKDVR